MEGKGIWRKGIADSASIYEGDFVNDMKHGKGIYKWGNSGNTYKGDYNKNKRHGYGTFIWLDGTIYEGYWTNDKMHGKGKIDGDP